MARQPGINELLSHPEFNTAVDLLRNREVIIRIGSGAREMRAAFAEVEAFNGLLDQRYVGPFDRNENHEGKERERGDLFVIWPHGQPTLSIVENGAERSIVVFKLFEIASGERVTLKKLLTDREFGSMKPDAMRDFVRGLDGATPGPEVGLRLEESQQQMSVRIAHEPSPAKNSWGKIRRVKA